MIQSPAILATKTKKVRILIAGYPGIGKSTLGLSAPNPLHIDVDRGADRVKVYHRKPLIQPENYGELLDDLRPNNITDFETLVFDTGGQLLKLMSSWAISKDAKYGQRDGSLSLKGYGYVGKEFERLMNYCYYELNKHIVILFHAKEEKDNDNTRLRLLVEGQTKDNVWQPMDLGGFMEKHGNDTVIGFDNCERYFAKGTHGITGVHRIPVLTDKNNNDFLTRLFVQINENISKDAEIYEKELLDYEAVMNDVQQIIDGIISADTANEAVDKMRDVPFVLTAEREAKNMFGAKIKELGLIYNKESKTYREPDKVGA